MKKFIKDKILTKIIPYIEINSYLGMILLAKKESRKHDL